MIIKTSDGKEADLAELHSLATRPDIGTQLRRRIEDEIRAIQAGVKGEKEAAYELEFHYGTSENWMVLHDLRLECEGRVAQIDHLIVNRHLQIWLCETKHFTEGVEFNIHGECLAIYGGKRYGRPSPIEQNHKHIRVLGAALRTGLVKAPKRLGFTLEPELIPLVLVSAQARIIRPDVDVPGLDSVIKSDQLRERLAKDVLGGRLRKLVGPTSLAEFARSLAGAHVPHSFDWAAKFGLTGEGALPVLPPQSDADATTHASCASCGAPVTSRVAAFCRGHKERFGDQVYCRLCQMEHPGEVQAASAAAGSPAAERADSGRPTGLPHTTCATCGLPVGKDVVFFCRMNKARFDGKIYCRNCQKDHFAPKAGEQ